MFLFINPLKTLYNIFLLLFFASRANAQLIFPVEGSLELSKDLYPDYSFHAGISKFVSNDVEAGAKLGFTYFIDQSKPYFPLYLFSKVYFNTQNHFLVYFSGEAGYGIYKQTKPIAEKGGIYGFLGFGIKYNSYDRFPVYTTAGLSAFEFKDVFNHSYVKRLSLRVGVDF